MARSNQNLDHLSRIPGRVFILTRKVFKITNVEELETQNLEYKRIEEVFQDKESEFFDTKLLNGPIESVKAKLKIHKDQGTKFHSIFRSYFHYFSTEKTLKFPEFVGWCACNYSSSERVIMDATKSNILCPIKHLVIRNTFSIPVKFTQVSKEFNEEIIMEYFREFTIEQKQVFFKTCFKPDP